jgi:transglutaminase-like putative cysteine protease
MKLKIGCELDYYSFGNTPLITMLRLRREHEQSIESELLTTYPTVPITEYLDLYGNYCQRFVIPEGSFKISIASIVEVSDNVNVNIYAELDDIDKLPQDTLIYLLPSRYCESDRFNNMAYEITYGRPTGYQMVEAIRLWVRQNIKYEYNHSSSSTSAIDTNNVKFGVCRDLSHLAIALCRGINIPARIVVGYLYLLHPMDLHAWFEAFIDGQWYTFDATQAVVTGGRVTLAYGRDAADVATATYFGNLQLNNMYVSVEQV